MKRVVITGIGAVTPLGNSVKTFWEALISGKSGVDKISRFDTEGFDVQIAAEVKDFKSEDYMGKKDAKRMDLFSQYAIAAAKQAIEDSRLDLLGTNSERFGVILGSGIGGISTLEVEHTKLMQKGPQRISPFFIPMMISNMAAGQISMAFGLRGSSMTITTACASGTNAIGEAFRMIKHGYQDAIVTGGTEASITKMSMAGFISMKALSTRNEEPSKASRPFDKDRDGFVMGEGAAILILEELEHAKARGAHIYAELVGYGSTSDAFHITQPDAEAKGATKAMELAILEANIDKASIGYINAHGTSTYYNDMLETLAIKNVFGSDAYNLNISSTKSMTGHLLGAAGGLEAIVCALSLENSLIPPTINYDSEAEGMDLNYTPNKSKERVLEAAMSNSLGFGGHNASLVFKKYR